MNSHLSGMPALPGIRVSSNERIAAIASGGSKCVQVFEGNGYFVIASIDDGWRHASISHRKRYPTWDEIKAVRDWFFPADMEVVMVLPRSTEYVNVSKNCFHLWQSRCGEEGR